MAPKRGDPRERILQRCSIKNDCWIWHGSQDKDGYGIINLGRKQYRAHRVSLEVFTGINADGKLVCHKCDNPSCVNPDHLFVGTAKDNTQDMIAKNRKYKMTDKNHPNTKICHQERSDIIKRRNNGESLKSIAQDYSVTFQTISAICLGKRSYEATK